MFYGSAFNGHCPGTYSSDAGIAATAGDIAAMKPHGEIQILGGTGWRGKAPAYIIKNGNVGTLAVPG
jgi:hypothetical protein